jgi:aryl-alcohol dehydrogenase-like predicted oxidoreductase
MRLWYGTVHDEQEMISPIPAAVNRGITFFDAAKVYGPYANGGALLGKAMTPIRTMVVLATRFGFNLNPGIAESAPPAKNRHFAITLTSDGERLRPESGTSPTARFQCMP